MRVTLTLLIAGLLGIVGCSNQIGPAPSASSATNADLKQTIQSKLAADPQLAKIDVSADADQNQVTLSGSVSSEHARNAAVEAAKSVRASLTVVDKIEVKPEVVSRSEYTEDMAREARQKAQTLGDKIGQGLGDAWLYTKIEAQLATDSATPALKINVDVVDNVVTLRGDVGSTTAKEEAERIAKETDGVRQVRNLLRVNA